MTLTDKNYRQFFKQNNSVMNLYFEIIIKFLAGDPDIIEVADAYKNTDIGLRVEMFHRSQVLQLFAAEGRQQFKQTASFFPEFGFSDATFDHIMVILTHILSGMTHEIRDELAMNASDPMCFKYRYLVHKIELVQCLNICLKTKHVGYKDYFERFSGELLDVLNMGLDLKFETEETIMGFLMENNLTEKMNNYILNLE